MARPRERTVRRSAVVAAALVLALGFLGTGIPSVASADTGAGAGAGSDATPAPADPAPAPGDTGVTPVPTPPDSSPTAPGATDPAPAAPTPGTPSPADPSPLPTTPLPTSPLPPAPLPTSPLPTGPTPDEWMPAPAGGAGGEASVDGTSSSAAAPIRVPVSASFAVVYPTNPWIFDAALPGTRYLDARESVGGVTRLHMGIDAQGGVRQPIFAVADGVVVGGTWGTSNRDGHGFGNQVQLAHADGFATRYAHLATEPLVRMGEHVTAGQVIGYMGGSQRGNLNALPRHLHFEVTKDARIIDPLAFLGGAAATGPSPAATSIAPVVSAPPEGAQLHEIRPAPGGGFVSIATGVPMSSTVFSSVLIGGWSADTYASEGGRLVRISVEDGAWTKSDLGLALDATSLSGAFTGTGYPELFAVEDGMLYSVTGKASGWTKTWTGHYFTGTVSAVRLANGRVGAMLEEGGYLAYLSPASRGTWSLEDTGIRVDGPVSAVSAGGSAPVAMGVIGGRLCQIARHGTVWDASPTGFAASGSIVAMLDAASRRPTALSVEPSGLAEVLVADQRWKRRIIPLDTPAVGPLSAVTMEGVGTLLYSVG